jgi:two-component system, OmpR family, response regulator
MRVLLVEDDPRVARVVARALRDVGHLVDPVENGRDAVDQARAGRYDLIVLDVLLPGLNGFSVCRTLRESGDRTPILMLTAKDAVPDRVRGLDAGADDYLTKPFAREELVARVRALGRRAGEPTDDRPLRVGDLVLDPRTRAVRRGAHPIDLTAKEFRLLEYLMRNAGRVLTKEQITDQVWGYDSEATSNVVEIYVHYLRDKVDRDFPAALIRTVRGVGYTLKEQPKE